IADRGAAEGLKGLRLYVPRAALPAPGEDEFYLADLVGLAAETADGTRVGTVLAVHDFGAGDVLELRQPIGGTIFLPFTRAVVPVV
ncbi:ribosome maturation factor RimM, partial [Acinetobacter baumannii]